MFITKNHQGKELINKLNDFTERFTLFLKESSFGNRFQFNGISIIFDDVSYPESFKKNLHNTLDSYLKTWGNNHAFSVLIEKGNFKDALYLVNTQISESINYLHKNKFDDGDNKYIHKALQYISDLCLQFMLELEQMLALNTKGSIKKKHEKLLFGTISMLKSILESIFINGIPNSVKALTPRLMLSFNDQ